MSMQDIIKKYALANALAYDGKADPSKLFGKVFKEIPDAKDKKAQIIKEIDIIVAGVNALSMDEQRALLAELDPSLLERKKQEKVQLRDLPNAVPGKFIARIAPSPSGPLHIGHAYILGVNHLYAKKYDGKVFVRIEDTNANNIDPTAYQLIERDARWLTGDDIAGVVIQSDRIDTYYRFAERLLEHGHLYVCSCENFKQYVDEKVQCPCRSLKKEDHLHRWKDMFNVHKAPEGSYVVRFAGDMTDKDPSMRDFPLLRINDTPHPRTASKYRVWPLMNFAVAIDDMEMGVTHAIRGKDHATNARRQKLIHAALQANTPTDISCGRINFEGIPVSCSQVRALIASGDVTGWDDVRIPFLNPMRMRGYQPQAFLRFALEVGISATDKSIKSEEYFKQLDAFNREVIDATAYRYSFVANPTKVQLRGAPELTVEMHLHPEHKKGGRVVHTKQAFYLAQEDVDSLRDGEEVRLKDCINLRKTKEGLVYASKEHDVFKGKRLIQWVADDDIIRIQIIMPDATTVAGIAEKYVRDVRVGQTVQFERVGYVTCTADAVAGPDGEFMRFLFLHK